VTCEPGIDQTDFVRWSFPVPGEIIAAAIGRAGIYVLLLAKGGPLLVLVDTKKPQRLVWKTAVPTLASEPVDVEKRRVQIHVDDELIVVSSDEGERRAWQFDLTNGKLRTAQP
jgi:hypothetical protein